MVKIMRVIDQIGFKTDTGYVKICTGYFQIFNGYLAISTAYFKVIPATLSSAAWEAAFQACSEGRTVLKIMRVTHQIGIFKTFTGYFKIHTGYFRICTCYFTSRRGGHHLLPHWPLPRLLLLLVHPLLRIPHTRLLR